MLETTQEDVLPLEASPSLHESKWEESEPYYQQQDVFIIMLLNLLLL